MVTSGGGKPEPKRDYTVLESVVSLLLVADLWPLAIGGWLRILGWVAIAPLAIATLFCIGKRAEASKARQEAAVAALRSRHADRR